MKGYAQPDSISYKDKILTLIPVFDITFSERSTLVLLVDRTLIALKNKTIINQQEFNGGVAQLVRAQDS